ncbi:hypothetical protein NMY22_g6404 [Coprinellus aureogranulatus]|nr:hypothetical protein NMY22_g6404 [Coprinellus aureogranulatus]
MSPRASFPFGELPQELQREIFVVAVQDNPKSAHDLVLVARRICDWIQPFIYRVVALGKEDAVLFLRTVAAKPPEFFATHVKHLCLSIAVSSARATKILDVCSGVVELALWVDFGGTLSPTTSKAGASLSSLPLRRLSIEHAHFLSFLAAPKSVTPPWYDTLTHLEVVFWKRELSPVIPGLEVLSSLTHLTLGLRHAHVEEGWLSAIVACCPRLKVLIPMANEDDEVEEPFLLRNCWIVPLTYPHSVIENWEASYWGLPDNYTRAEEEIRLKQESDRNHKRHSGSSHDEQNHRVERRRQSRGDDQDVFQTRTVLATLHSVATVTGDSFQLSSTWFRQVWFAKAYRDAVEGTSSVKARRERRMYVDTLTFLCLQALISWIHPSQMPALDSGRSAGLSMPSPNTVISLARAVKNCEEGDNDLTM